MNEPETVSGHCLPCCPQSLLQVCVCVCGRHTKEEPQAIAIIRTRLGSYKTTSSLAQVIKFN